MKPITGERYGDKEYSWYGAPSYDHVIDSFDVKVLLSRQVGSYQGDYLVLLRDGQRIGYLCFGYGSCSGCDALEACESDEELLELRDGLWGKITWYDSPADLLEWFEEHDWEGDFIWHEGESHIFVDEAKALLRDLAA